MPKNPDLTTFRTDFNVTFGVCICFDLFFHFPANGLVERGVRNFVFPTMWFSEIPYLSGEKTSIHHLLQNVPTFNFISAVQYQQSWAYTNNVNLLAANINWPSLHCSGSGIFSGRFGALEAFVSQTPTTKVLIAKVPSMPSNETPQSQPQSESPQLQLIDNSTCIGNIPKYETFGLEIGVNSTGMKDMTTLYDDQLGQEDMTAFTVQFLDFSTYSNHTGTVCNGRVCCRYNIDTFDHGQLNGMVCYFSPLSWNSIDL